MMLIFPAVGACFKASLIRSLITYVMQWITGERDGCKREKLPINVGSLWIAGTWNQSQKSQQRSQQRPTPQSQVMNHPEESQTQRQAFLRNSTIHPQPSPQ
jgi:hypothetical protein